MRGLKKDRLNLILSFNYFIRDRSSFNSQQANFSLTIRTFDSMGALIDSLIWSVVIFSLGLSTVINFDEPKVFFNLHVSVVV